MSKDKDSIGASVPRIIARHVFTLFNAFNFAIGICLAAVGAYENLLYLGVILCNILIGIVQGVRSAKIVEKLSLLTAPSVTVVRNGVDSTIKPEELKRGDMFRLGKGMEICADAHVVSGEVFANEALLTGESVPIRKGEGDSMLSGSFVMSGSCIAKADRVGDACYANTIAKEAKKLKGNSSIILASLNKIVRFTSYFIVPLGAVLFYESYFAAALPLKESVVTASAALLGLLPKGLVLLTSVSLAVGVIRLGKKQTLVQELYAIESLARVDVLCMDKTGTLADETGRIRPESPAALEYFKKQGVRLMLFSGDSAEAVGKVAEAAGLGHEVCDASALESDIDYVEVFDEYSAFCRMMPERKLALVKALQAEGHTVGFVGDGVNDVLAIHQADCGIAMASGCDAARRSAKLVLMDNSFASLPGVVSEGRRVINNISRVAALFLTKTCFTFILSLICALTGRQYPFTPLQISIYSALFEAIPAFMLTFRPNAAPIHGDIVRTAIRRALPFAIAVAAGEIVLALMNCGGIWPFVWLCAVGAALVLRVAGERRFAALVNNK